MADRIKGITIEIGGDTSSLSKAISGVNQGLKGTQEQLRDVERLLKLDPGNTQLLEQQQRLLAQSIESTTKKLEILKTAETQAQEKFKEGKVSQEQYDALTREIVYTENALEKLTRRADENAEAMKNAGKVVEDTTQNLEESSDTSLNLGDALYQIADAAGVSVPPALEKTMNMMSGVNAKGLVVTGTIVGIVTALGKLTVETAKTAKEIETFSAKMGMTTTEFQEWDYVMKQFGSSASDMQGDISGLAEKAMDAANGGEDAAEAFKKLGIDVLDSKKQLKDQSTLFSEVVSKLQRMKNETERSAIATELLSTTGENLIPILNMSAEELENMKEEAHKFGAVMSDETLSSFSKLSDEMTKFDQSIDSAKQNLALALLPILTDFFETIGSIPPETLLTIIKVISTIAGLIIYIKMISGIAKTVNSITDAINAMNPSLLKTYAIIAGIIALLTGILLLIAAIKGKKEDVSSIKNDINSIQNDIKNPNKRYPAYANGTSFHPGGWAIVGEQGRELVWLPRGSAVYPNSETERILSGGGGDTFYITVEARNVKELNDLVWMAQNARRDRRSR